MLTGYCITKHQFMLLHNFKIKGQTFLPGGKSQ